MIGRSAMELLRRAGRSSLAAPLERTLRRLGVPEHGTLLVAASGGVDSTALLLLAAAVASRRGWRVECATVDHHLREDSALDADHVERLAASIGVPCHRLDVHPGAGRGAPARARRERYEALRRCARDRGIACVVTGHHAHDQLETMLLAIVRGAGVRAAGGMSARRALGEGVELIRPLLEVPRPALESLCRRLGATWREDPTNQAIASPRVALRRIVLPELDRLRPGAARRGALLATLLRAAGRRFERDAARRAGVASSPNGDGPSGMHSPLSRAGLGRLGRAERLETIRAFVRSSGGRLAASALLEVDAAVVDRRRHLRSWRIGRERALELVADELRVSDRCSAPASRETRSGSVRSRPSSPPAA